MKKSFNGPELNKHAEGFDMGMEILCSIPPYPSFVACSTLVSDFDLKSQDVLSGIIKELKAKKMLVVQSINPNNTKLTKNLADSLIGIRGRVYTIPVKNDNWVNVKRACTEYWDKVVDPQPMPTLRSSPNLANENRESASK